MANKTVFITTTGLGTFTVPVDYVSLVSVAAIGGGGNGSSNSGGGGGGAYAASTSIVTSSWVPGSTVLYYRVGVANGTTGVNGTGKSWFNTSNAEPTLATTGVMADCGITATTGTGGVGGATVNCVGTVTFAGGAGGSADAGTASNNKGGGGGGAGGPNGAGGNGGSVSLTANGSGGGGGGDGGFAGGSVSSATGGGAGGGNFWVATGPAGALNQNTAAGTAFLGAGGGGSFNYTSPYDGLATSGSTAPSGSGGGGGGGDFGSGALAGRNGGLYGGGGGGAGSVAGVGAQGTIIFTYNYDETRTFTGFKTLDPNTNLQQDLGDRYLTKSYLIDAYPTIASFTNNNRTTPGLWVWGSNNWGQLGQNFSSTSVYYSSPIQVGSLVNWKQISVAPFNTYSVKKDGTMWSWGGNQFRQLGINVASTTTYYSSPVQIGALTTWKYVAGNSSTCFALKNDGTLWGWGANHLGQLGLGTITLNYYSSPIQVGALATWRSIAVSSHQSTSGAATTVFGIRTDGALFGWGWNGVGQLGLGNLGAAYYSAPVQVGALTNWKQVAIGGHSSNRTSFTMAVKTDGTLWAWGSNVSGQFGTGYFSATNYYSSPIQVGSLTDWKLISISPGTSAAAGYDGHIMAIKTDGTLWGWGTNNVGQLGNGTTTTYISPIQVGVSTNWKKVQAFQSTATGSRGTIAIRKDGTLWAWGDSAFGQLGTSNVTAYSSPVQVGTLTTWKDISSGANHSAAILDGNI